VGLAATDRRRPQAVLQGSAVPGGANKKLFVVGPVMAIAPALAAWAVVPFSTGGVLANIDAGLLYLSWP
jgi:NADH-quinone oxidoreductase subunit H